MSTPLHPQRGITLVEMLIGLTLGLAIVAAALAHLGSQVSESRHLLSGARTIRELRAVSDIMTRQLRRAAYWDDATAEGIWHPALGRPHAGADLPTQANPHAGIYITPQGGLDFWASPQGDDTGPTRNVSIRRNEGVLQMRLDARSGWQDLTDPRTLTVTRFDARLQEERTSLASACGTACPQGSACPGVRVRSVVLALSARPADSGAPEVRLSWRAHLPNDVVDGACP